MAKPIYHSSIEGAQHGGKGLEGFLAFAKEAGAAGAQPSHYMFEDGDTGEAFKKRDRTSATRSRNTASNSTA